MTAMADVVAKLDELGRAAWIAIMVVGFILFWPIGLGILGYLIWSGRMGRMGRIGCGQRGFGRWHEGAGEERRRGSSFRGPFGSSGNRAFDEYREETLRRLEDEQKEFSAYLDRLRHAKDKAEFDAFMAERRSRAGGSFGSGSGSGPVPDAGPGGNEPRQN
jgi:hypothetical protein